MRPFSERSRSQGRRSATAGPGGLGVGRAGGPPASTRLTAGEVARRARERGNPWIVPDSQHPRPYHPRPPHPRPSEAGAMPVLPRPESRPESRPVASSRSSAGPRGKPVSSALRFARLGWAVLSVMTLTISGAAWHELGRIADGFSRSNALAGAAHSAGGAENILLVGLDTRKDQNGDDLPPDILRALHAGDGQEGGYNTNSIILVHIPADRKNIVAFSIPRDDLVAMTGVDVPEAKIKEAYGRRKAIVEQQLSAEGVTDPHTLEEQGREAGRAEVLQTVRDLLGVPIDRFAEISLVGFYDLAEAVGGIEVCLNHAVDDSDYSGARLSAGHHILTPAQALAFVRQRHGLTNGDLDRTHRQQAFLLSALHTLRSQGAFADATKLDGLISVIHRDVVLSSGWDLLDWSQDMLSVSGQRISFRTLPVRQYATVDGQDVNLIDPVAVRTQVQQAFGVPVTAPSSEAGSGSVVDTSTASGEATDSADASSGNTTNSAAPAPDSGADVIGSDSVPCVN